MARIDEIESRLAELRTLNLDEVEDLKVIEDEVDSLNQEKREIIQQAQERSKVVESIASDVTQTEIVESKEVEITMERTFAIDSAEYRSAFLKNLMGIELDVEERTALNGTSAIPTETMNQIVSTLEVNPVLDAIDMTQIPGYVKFPVEGTTADASWTSTSTDSADTLDYITLGAYQLIKTIEVGADVDAMSIDAFESWLVSRLANKIEVALENAVIDGDGKNKPTGLNTTYASTTNTYTKDGMVYADLMNIIATLPTKYTANASFVMKRDVFYKEVLGMTDQDGQRVVVADAQSPAKFNVLGYPVILDDACDFVYFGDMKSYKLNISKAPVVDKDASVGFRSGSQVYRAMTLADGKVADTNSIVAFKEAE